MKTTEPTRLIVRQKQPQALCVKSGDNSGFYVWESHSKRQMLGHGPTASKAWLSALIKIKASETDAPTPTE